MTLENVFTLKDLAKMKLVHARALARTDLDSTTKEGIVQPNERLNQTVSLTTDLTQDYNIAKVLLWGHHKRPGEKDFTDLSQHAEIIGKDIKGVRFTSFADQATIDGITERVIVLDNTRMIVGEQEGTITPLHQRYAALAAFYILDAPAVIHRKDTSISGMHELMPIILGPGIVNDLTQLDKGVQAAKSGPALYLFGGMKINDLQGLIKNIVEDTNYENRICASGGLGLLALDIMEYYVGPSLDIVKKKLKKNYDTFRAALAEAMDKKTSKGEPIILTPVDIVYNHNSSRVEVAIEELKKPDNPYIQSYAPDIGPKTVELYSKQLNGKSVVLKKGPDGFVEDENFREGSKGMLTAMIDYTTNGGRSIIWGGEGGEAVGICGLDKNGITHICMGGGSSVKYFLNQMYGGKPLPGLESAQKSFEKALNGDYDNNQLGIKWNEIAKGK